MKNPSSLVKSDAQSLKTYAPAMKQGQQMIALGEDHRWSFRVLGAAPVPKDPVFTKNWWLVPVEQDSSQIPARALERVQAIYAAGIRPQAFIIAHETSERLPAPKGRPISRTEVWAHQAAACIKTAIQITEEIAEAVIPIAEAALTAGAVLAIGMASMVFVDPCLIAVTEDNVWIQIDYWME
jgi:hypothetical protein